MEPCFLMVPPAPGMCRSGWTSATLNHPLGCSLFPALSFLFLY